MVTKTGDKDPNNLNDTLEGTDGPDVLFGLQGSDTLRGLAGDDILNGGNNPPGWVSVDFLDGGEGIDRVNIDPHRPDGTLETVGLNFFSSPNGDGTVTWVLNSFGPAHYNLRAINVERLSFTGGLGDDTVNLVKFSTALAPHGGNYINGGGGSDHLIAPFGAPEMPWGKANITYDIKVQNVIPGFGSIMGFEQLTLETGSGNDRIISGRLVDTIGTHAGNDFIDPGTHPLGWVAFDTVDGGAGTDTLNAHCPTETKDTYFYAGAGDWLIGGSANQLYIKATGMERVDFHGGGGDDTFDITGAKGGSVNGYGLSQHKVISVDHLIADFGSYAGRIDYSVFHNGTDLPGFNIANVDRITLTTGRGNDEIVGLYHQDIIKTGAGNDTINPRSKQAGGLGDFIDGGAGVDTLVIDVRSDPGAKYAGLGITATLHTITSNKDTVKVDADNMEIFHFQGGTGADNVTGGTRADVLVGNEGNDKLFGGLGNDELDGWAGSDLLVGGRGKDEMFGGYHGRDVFKFESILDSVAGINRDVITGMGGGATSVDKIDLGTIDANTKLGGNQAFKFIGAQAFHKTAGELRYANHLLQADVNGDGRADFEVSVNQNVLALANFIL